MAKNKKAKARVIKTATPPITGIFAAGA